MASREWSVVGWWRLSCELRAQKRICAFPILSFILSTSMELDADLKDTLLRTSDWLADTKDPWWILGSAAIALLGVDPNGVRDIDVLVSERDAEALMIHHSLENRFDGGTTCFRSNTFILPNLGALRVEVMAGYEIRVKDEWLNVWPQTRFSVVVSGSVLWIPEAREQIEILRMLNRPKDLGRIELIEAAITAQRLTSP